MKSKLGLIFVLATVLAGPAFAGTHFFTDGQIPDSIDIIVGVVSVENEWDELEYDVMSIPFRVESAFTSDISWFVEGQFQDYDDADESTFSLGLGVMYKFIDSNESMPIDLSARGSIFYGMDEEKNGWTIIPSFVNIEGRLIASKRLDNPVDWTPYAAAIITYSEADWDVDDDSEMLFDVSVGSRFRFNQLGINVEAILGDQTGFGIGAVYSF